MSYLFNKQVLTLIVQGIPHIDWLNNVLKIMFCLSLSKAVSCQMIMSGKIVIGRKWFPCLLNVRV